MPEAYNCIRINGAHSCYHRHYSHQNEQATESHSGGETLTSRIRHNGYLKETFAHM